MCKYDEDRREMLEAAAAERQKEKDVYINGNYGGFIWHNNNEDEEQTKTKQTIEFLKDFFADYDPGVIKYVYNKSYKIKFYGACDLFPFYFLPQITIYRGYKNIWFSFTFLFFRFEIDFISLLN